jgi:hypothetical protein
LDLEEEQYSAPTDAPVTLAAYAAGGRVDVFLEHVSFGAVLPPMPLFFCSERYVDVPLEATYGEAFGGVPRYWRDVLEKAP